jgi:hypothetical protein
VPGSHRGSRLDLPGELAADPAGRRISWQATKTWKASADPDFIAKIRRVLDLYDHPPAGGRVSGHSPGASGHIDYAN